MCKAAQKGNRMSEDKNKADEIGAVCGKDSTEKTEMGTRS